VPGLDKPKALIVEDGAEMADLLAISLQDDSRKPSDHWRVPGVLVAA
jgi:hypothetical protein